jgi:hypothetical protein
MCFLQFDEDLILVPPQTAWFGYYAENEFGSRVLAPNEVTWQSFPVAVCSLLLYAFCFLRLLMALTGYVLYTYTV